MTLGDPLTHLYHIAENTLDYVYSTPARGRELTRTHSWNHNLGNPLTYLEYITTRHMTSANDFTASRTSG